MRLQVDTPPAQDSRAEQQAQWMEINAELAGRLPSAVEVVQGVVCSLQTGTFSSGRWGAQFAEWFGRFMSTPAAGPQSQQQAVSQQQSQQLQTAVVGVAAAAAQAQPQTLQHGLDVVLQTVLQRFQEILEGALACARPADALRQAVFGMYEACVALTNQLLPDFQACLRAAGVEQQPAWHDRVMFDHILSVLRNAFSQDIAPRMYLTPEGAALAQRVTPITDAERVKVYYIAGYLASTIICKHIAGGKKRATTNKPYPGNVDWDMVHCLAAMKLFRVNGVVDDAGLPDNVLSYMRAMDRGGLTWVTPAFFELMLSVEQVVRTHLDKDKMDPDMVVRLQEELRGGLGASLELRARFHRIVLAGLRSLVACSRVTQPIEPEAVAESSTKAFVALVCLYIKVRVREFKHHVDRNKKELKKQDALRRQLKALTAHKKQALKFTITTESVQALGGVSGMHVALLGLIWTHGITVIEHLVVPQLKLLCQAYGVNNFKGKKKDDLRKLARDLIVAPGAEVTLARNAHRIQELCVWTPESKATGTTVAHTS